MGLKVGELGWLGSRLKLKHRRIVCFRKKPKQALAPRFVRIEEPHTKRKQANQLDALLMLFARRTASTANLCGEKKTQKISSQRRFSI